MRRRDGIAPELQAKYKQLCAPTNKVTSQLFGDNLVKQVKDIKEAGPVTTTGARYQSPHKAGPSHGYQGHQHRHKSHHNRYKPYPQGYNNHSSKPFLGKRRFNPKKKGGEQSKQ